MSKVPQHVAIIMDGNGRWARARFLPRTAGHKQGVETTREVVKACAERGVEALTLFAFSSENWRRPAGEVSTLMELFFTALRREAKQLAESNVRLRVIGDVTALPAKLQSEIHRAEAITAHTNGMILQIAANYGGRNDIVSAIQQLAHRIRSGEIEIHQIDEQEVGRNLSTAGVADPDLFIRTGGEKRISNFLLWQLAYTELYFSELAWPDFDTAELERAFAVYAGRERRFGMTSEQVIVHA
ncbi:MAG: isoprenyl transferase [Thiotrichales bacterium]